MRCADPFPCELRVRSSIPGSVGLAASSAIVVAALRALDRFNGVEAPDRELPGLALAAEEDLGIPGGLQDRVVQVYEGLVYMDFDPKLMTGGGHGHHEQLDPALLPPLYVAWSNHAAVPSSEFHSELRARVAAGDREALSALHDLAELARQARDRLLSGDTTALASLIDANFDLRRALGPLDERHVRMVETAREVGACANYAGSGGAITGLAASPKMLSELKEALGAIDCRVIEPDVGGS